MITTFEYPEVGTDERYDSMTITLGEWHELGFYKPLEDDSWRFDAYSDEQYTRLCNKILDRFYLREVSIPTPYIWKRAYIRYLNEIMPKYKIEYKLIENGVDPLRERTNKGKSRSIFSDFPETMLSGNSDYASSGTDNENIYTVDGNVINAMSEFDAKWNDVDVIILDKMEHKLFSSIAAPTLPLW